MRLSIATLALSLAVAASAVAGTAPPPHTLSVAVTPFDVLGDSGSQWLGRALQEGVATGLQKATGISGIFVPGLAPEDAPSALAMAKPSAADIVVFGSVQLVDGQIRILGQVVSPSTGASLGTLKCDAPETSLFDVEDRLAGQVQRILTPVARPNPKAAATPPPTLQLVGPTVATTGSRYFDGNLMSQINPPAKNRDDYDRYYYYTSDTAAYGACCGAAFPWYSGFSGFGGFCGGFVGGGAAILPIATPVHGW